MSVIVREDQKRFIVQPYRELINYRSLALFKRELSYLASLHGQYVQTYKKPDGRIEAVFAREPGYLLAEAVWEYFQKPTDLIYCEELPDQQHAVVVIVRASQILFDARLPIETLGEELANLLTLKAQFAIHLYGNIPIDQYREEQKIAFDSDKTWLFNYLDEPVIPKLALTKSALLSPLNERIAQFNRKRTGAIGAVSAVFLVCIVGIGAWYFPKIEKTIPHTFVKSSTMLASSPKRIEKPSILTVIAYSLIKSYNLPGWIPNAVTYQDNRLLVGVQSFGGSLSRLQAWASQYGMSVQLSEAGVTLVYPVFAETTPAVVQQYTALAISQSIIDRLSATFPEISFTILSRQQTRAHSLVVLDVNFRALAPDNLIMISKVLSRLSARINKLSGTVDNGLMDGSLTLAITGG